MPVYLLHIQVAQARLFSSLINHESPLFYLPIILHSLSSFLCSVCISAHYVYLQSKKPIETQSKQHEQRSLGPPQSTVWLCCHKTTCSDRNRPIRVFLLTEQFLPSALTELVCCVVSYQASVGLSAVWSVPNSPTIILP